MPEFDDTGGGTIAPPRPPTTLPPGPPPTPHDDWGYRCVMCNIDWPALDDPTLIGLPPDYRFRLPRDEEQGTCPVCLNRPLHIACNINPLPMDEAWSLKNHADFDRYYAKTRGE